MDKDLDIQGTRHVFFDYDGTLSSRQSGIPQSAFEAIDRLRENGHFVALATGRLQVNAVDLMQTTGIDSIVSDGGNSVTVHGKLLMMEGMDIGKCRRFLHWLDDHGRCWAVVTENKLRCYTRSEEYVRQFSDYYVRALLVPGLEIDSLDCIYKIFVPCAPGEEEGFDFGGVTWARYNPRAIYCEPTDKARGIKEVMRILRKPVQSVVVFGDGSNDMEMFRPEWVNVAMGNAIPELKTKADLVTSDLEDDGVLKACELLGLI